MSTLDANPGTPAPSAPIRAGRSSLWGRAWDQLKRDRTGLIGLSIVLIFALVAVGVWLGWWGTEWSQTTGGRWEGPSFSHWLGTNLLGQDIFQRAIYSTRVAFDIGLLVALLSTLLGGVLGALSGYFANRWIDGLLLWLMGTLDSIPFYLFVAAVAVALAGNPWAMHLAMVATFWTTTARLVRGEVIKLNALEFVEAAHAIGLSPLQIIFRHLLPNTLHILLVQGTIVFVSAIKAEVILSFLGLGIQDGVSWGLMIAESTQEVLAGEYMNFIAASLFMFVLVMAFNVFSDALQDAVDPRQATP
ncbi:MAG: ABC transporter permease [Pseudomonadota bacterium]